MAKKTQLVTNAFYYKYINILKNINKYQIIFR